MNTTTKKLPTADDINALVSVKRGSDQQLREVAEANRKAGDEMRNAVSLLNEEFMRRVRAELGVESLDELFPTFTIEIETGRYSSKRTKKYAVHYKMNGYPHLFAVSYGYERHTFSLCEEGASYLYASLADKSDRSPPTPYGFDRSKYEQYNGIEKVKAAAKKVAAQMIREFNLDSIKCYK
jgi:hypothetical protein